MGIKGSLIALGELPYRHCTVTLYDGTELIADNCSGVVSCTDCREDDGEIVLRLRQADGGRLMRVRGERLLLENMDGDGVKILGKITSISLIEL